MRECEGVFPRLFEILNRLCPARGERGEAYYVRMSRSLRPSLFFRSFFTLFEATTSPVLA